MCWSTTPAPPQSRTTCGTAVRGRCAFGHRIERADRRRLRGARPTRPRPGVGVGRRRQLLHPWRQYCCELPRWPPSISTAGRSSTTPARQARCAQRHLPPTRRGCGSGPPTGLPRYRSAELHGPVEARGTDVAGSRVHSVRLPSFVVSTEVVFGGTGERLVMRHDAGGRHRIHTSAAPPGHPESGGGVGRSPRTGRTAVRVGRFTSSRGEADGLRMRSP